MTVQRKKPRKRDGEEPHAPASTAVPTSQAPVMAVLREGLHIDEVVVGTVLLILADRSADSTGPRPARPPRDGLVCIGHSGSGVQPPCGERGGWWREVASRAGTEVGTVGGGYLGGLLCQAAAELDRRRQPPLWLRSRAT